MRIRLRVFPVLVLLASLFAAWSAHGAERRWRQVHPYYREAYVLSFRSGDLLTYDADERWGREDGRLISGGILNDFPLWLRSHEGPILKARKEGRPIVLAFHTHGGYGTGIVTYTPDLKRAEVVNYPWLIRELLATGLCTEDVTVAVDTCNAQTIAAHQIRPDLVPAGVAAWPPFARWRKAHPSRRKLPISTAYRLYEQDRVRLELAPGHRASRANVEAVPWIPLTREERKQFRAKLYGPKGVIFATPALFNVLRLGPSPRGTLTANLMTDRLTRGLIDDLLDQNKAEFQRFTEYAFLESSGPGPGIEFSEPEPSGFSRTARIEQGSGD